MTFRNVPCFVFGLDRLVEVEGLGTLKVDVAYGGMIYVLVDAQALGFAIDPSEARELVSSRRAHQGGRGGAASGRSSGQSADPHHQSDPVRRTARNLADGRKTARNTVIVSPGRLDRSPCGTGTSARLAVMHARGQIKAGETFVHESIIGSEFRGVIDEAADVAGIPGIVPSITGRAWMTAFHQYVLDPSDPFPTGYRIADTWPDAPSAV